MFLLNLKKLFLMKTILFFGDSLTAGMLVQRAYNPGGTSINLRRRVQDNFEAESFAGGPFIREVQRLGLADYDEYLHLIDGGDDHAGHPCIHQEVGAGGAARRSGAAGLHGHIGGRASGLVTGRRSRLLLGVRAAPLLGTEGGDLNGTICNLCVQCKPGFVPKLCATTLSDRAPDPGRGPLPIERLSMPQLDTQLNVRSAEFQANALAMRAVVDDLKAQVARVAAGGGEAARAKHTARGKLLPRDRVQMLLDPGTPFLEVAPLAALNMYGNDAPCADPKATAGLPCQVVDVCVHTTWPSNVPRLPELLRW